MWNPARELLEMIDSWDGSDSLIIARGEPANDDLCSFLGDPGDRCSSAP